MKTEHVITTVSTEEVSSHPRETGHWSQNWRRNTFRAVKNRWQSGKSSCNPVEQVENHKKYATTGVGNKPNGKSQHKRFMNASELISQTNIVEHDLTKGFPYTALVHEELQHYSQIEITDELTEGGIHAHKSWRFYFEYLQMNEFGTSFVEEVVAAVHQKKNPLLLSLGCGYGGLDLAIARRLQKPYQIFGVDLNPMIFSHAHRRAMLEGLEIDYLPIDLNFVELQPGSFDVIYAHASLHHLLNLEHVFAQIARALTPDGLFVLVDIIGKTQVLFWRQNVEFTAELIKDMPWRFRPPVRRLWRHFWFDPYTIISKYSEPAVQHGMEGIRQEEIEPVMMKIFEPVKLYKYNAFMRLICTNRYLGARLNPEKLRDREYLEKLIKIEVEQIKSGKLKPTEMFGVFKPKSA
jgi:SAM-dependent methyltransferase